MKKLIIILAILFSFKAHGQTQYNMYMDSLGFNRVSLTKTPQVAISGYYQNLLFLPTINNNITRPINSTTFTVSVNRTAIVNYNISISCTATIGSASAGKVVLQYSTNAGSTWNDVAEVSNSNTVTLAVVLNSVQVQGVVLTGIIPAGALVRMNSTSTGTTTITYIRGNEYY